MIKIGVRHLLCVLVGIFGPSADISAQDIILFEDGSTKLKIYLHKDATEDLSTAAQDFSETLLSMSGAKLPVETKPSEPGQGIFIEKCNLRPELNSPEPDLESFRIWTDKDGLHLSGQSDLALVHAIYTFLQEHGGCRWYTPGEIGTYIPKRKTWKLNSIDEVHQPDFLSREFFGLNSEEEKLWAKRNRLKRRFEYHHNLYTIFNQSVFEAHPEWFALINGERIPPRKNERTAQPNFSNLEAADYAAHTASEYFKVHPNALSFSLGMNDGIAIDTSKATRILTEPIEFFRDNPDYSDLIFRFMNRASETLGKTFPEKYLGCLAYYYALNVPSFPVSPKVIPYITADRSQWYDNQYKEEDLDLMRRWTQAGPEIVGIYDYYEGYPFVIPRIFTRYIHESILFAHSTGIRGFTAELYPIWPLDGPKAWLAAQLLWNTKRNRMALLDEFYKNNFGKAEKPMEHFYALCEDAWSRQPTPGWWLKLYKNPEQTEIFSKTTLKTLEDLLNIAHQKAEKKDSKEKIRQTINAFKTTLALTKLNQATKKLEELAVEKDASILTEAIQIYYIAREHLNEDTKDIKAWSFLAQRNPIPSTLSRFSGSNELNSSSLKKQIQAQDSNSDLAALNFLRGRPNTGKENLLKNTRLTTSDWYALDIPEWEQSSWTTPDAVIQAFQEGTSHRGILVKNQRTLSLRQTIPIKPGAWYIFSVNAQGVRSPAGSTLAFIQWEDSEREILGKSEQASLPQNQLTTYPLTSVGKAPEDAAFASFILRVSNQTKNDWTRFDQAIATEIAL